MSKAATAAPITTATTTQSYPHYSLSPFSSSSSSGLWKLSLLTSLLQPLGLFLLFLLPSSREEQEKLQKSDSRNFWGGLAFTVFLIGALLWVISQSISMMIQ